MTDEKADEKADRLPDYIEHIIAAIAPDQHVTITIEPNDWLAEVRRHTRPRVIEAGWSDADIERIIDEEREGRSGGRGQNE